jgi:hypothetical protein
VQGVQLIPKSGIDGLAEGYQGARQSRVAKIDRACLGREMSCYSHAVKNRGMLKLLNPTAEVQTLLHLTKIDSVVETYDEERQALESFGGA